jgi:hypothetical protein
VTLGLGEVVHDYLTKDQGTPVQSLSLEEETARWMKFVRARKGA